MGRAKFIEHRGKQIFQLDCSNCKAEEIHQIIDICARQVQAQPPKSVLTMTIAGGGKFDQETISRLKALTKGNEPYVRKAAVVGITGLYKVVLMAVSSFSQRQFHLFDTVEEAKDFLVED